MSRMSREFSLVLLGSGILTAGYFTAPSPEDEMEKKQDEQTAARTGHSTGHGYRPGGMFLFIHSPYYGGGTTNGRPAAYSPTTRAGGLGAAGRAFSGGGS
jgi:hypothetical protein